MMTLTTMFLKASHVKMLNDDFGHHALKASQVKMLNDGFDHHVLEGKPGQDVE